MAPPTASPDLLPWWLPWLDPAAWTVLGLVLGALLMAASQAWSARAVRRTRDGPWPAHAVAAWQARRSSLLVGLTIMVALLIFLQWFIDDRTPGGRVAWVQGAAAAAIVVVMLMHARQERRLWSSPLGLFGALRGSVAWTLVALGHLLLALVLAFVVPATAGGALVGVLLAALAAVLWVRGAGIVLGARLGLIAPPPPRLVALIDRASRQADVSVRGLHVLRWHKVNAFAFPASGRLVFTQGAVDHLDDDAILAIAGHELGHLAESRSTVVIRTLTAMAFTPLVGLPALLASDIPGAALLPFVATFGVLVVGQRIARRMEEQADAAGHGHHDEDSEVYARALETVYRINQVPPVLRGRRIHPDLVDRMRAAGVEPDWPMVDPPSARAGFLHGVLAGTVMVFAAVAFLIALPFLHLVVAQAAA